jgi:uncharacterized oxidoreductase
MKTAGNTILITGGATGIGFEIASLLLKNENEVIICGRHADKLESAKIQLPGIHIKVADVSVENNRKDLISWITDSFPDFNILINNAGIQQILFLNGNNTTSMIDDEISINLNAPIHFTDLVVPHFLKQKEAAIINISSGLGYIPIAIMPVYCATKAAIHSFSISSRHQLKDTPIKVFEIIPPIVETELGRDSSRKERIVRGIPASEVAIETLNALGNDLYEYPFGLASNLYNAAKSENSTLVFNNMNSRRE